MSTSQTQLTAEISKPEIRKYWLGYFQEGFRASIQRELLELFERAKITRGLSRVDLARKIGRRPEQVTRWLSSSSNLEADTISDIALGMGYIPRVSFESVEEAMARGAKTNHAAHPVSELVGGAGYTVAGAASDFTVKVEDGNRSSTTRSVPNDIGFRDLRAA